MQTFDLAETPLRDLNQALHAVFDANNDTSFEVVNPRGAHAVAVGIDRPISVDIHGKCRLLLRRHEQRRHRHRARLGRAGCRRKHDVRLGDR